MRVLALSLRNYRVFEEVDLELPARVIGIFGENGSGKSTLMESVGFALYGVDAARTKKQEIRTQGILADCLVRVVLEHGGQQYEVRRSLRGKGSVPEAELFGGGLLLASGTTEVDAEVQRLLHMDLRVFRASVFAEQKQLDAFSDVTPAKRKEMALRLLGIRPVDDARTAARREARASRHSAEQLSGAVADVAAIEAQLKEAKDVERGAKSRTKAARAELRGASGAHREAKAAFDASDEARQRVEKITVGLRAATEELDRLVARRADLSARVEALARDLEGLPEIEQELEGLAGAEEALRGAERLADASERLVRLEAQVAALPAKDAEAALGELKGAREELRGAGEAFAEATAVQRHELHLLEEAQERLARASEADPTQPCPTCGRPFGDDFAGYVKHCEEEVAGTKERVAAAVKAAGEVLRAKADVEARLKRAEEAAEGARTAEAQRAGLAGQADALRREVAELAAPFGEAPPDLGALDARVRRTRELAERVAELGAEGKRLEEAEGDLATADAQLAQLGKRLEGLAAEAKALSFDPRQHAELGDGLEAAESRLEEAREMERASADELSEAQQRVRGLEGEIRQARETTAKVDELRSEARHLERVAMLLDGFRDHLVSRVGPELSREAEALFRELTNHEYDDLRIEEETLTIQIADGDAFHPIERFSGSETDLANLALRVAISMHLSRVSGADVGMMVLDEVLGALDAERKDLMVQSMGRLSGRFHQLFVITHAEQVKDQFPASIDVRRVGRRRSVAVMS